MTEEEQKAIEKLEELNWSYFDMSESSSKPYLQAIDTILNLIKKYQKELEEKEYTIEDLKQKVFLVIKARNQADKEYAELLHKFSPVYDIEREKHIKKLENVIDEMAKKLVEAHGWFYSEFDNFSKEDFIEYFIKKVEEK